jgi:hypothetical protein
VLQPLLLLATHECGLAVGPHDGRAADLADGEFRVVIATLEGKEAAAIEAATATWYVNILDKAVFEEAHPVRYASLGPTTAWAE